MKKVAIIAVIIVVGLFVIATDMVVNPIQQWVVNNPKSSAAPRVIYTMAGYLYMVAQRGGKATELYQTAFRLFPKHPDEPEAHYRIALYYESKRDYPRAIDEYQLILKQYPDLGEKLNLNSRIDHIHALQGEVR
jgi:tetratricopeptide (TPR) repeat protein